MICQLQNPAAAASLFGDWPETMIWSCLQGVMGTVYGDHPVRPRSAAACLGDFQFFAGAPTEELTAFLPESRPFSLLVPQNGAWAACITRHYGRRAQPITRYATKKNPASFCREMLASYGKTLPNSYTICRINKLLYKMCLNSDWSRDLVRQFPNADAFLTQGMGVAALWDGELVAGASSYSVYQGGIEIEIDTREDHRRRGLARACGARLILDCLDRGLYPSWDAHTPASLALAEQLGYQPDRSYQAFALEP